MTISPIAEEMTSRSSHAGLDLVMREAYRAYGNRANFRGIDVGFRWQGGQPTDEICIRVHVDHKRPSDLLLKSQLLPSSFGGVRLDVIAASYQPSLDPGKARSAAARQPYTMGGLSCGRDGGGTGTIGMLVVDTTTGKPGVLSNWHVLAGPNARRNDPITQPGGQDGGFDPRDRIARLKTWLLDHSGDAAFAELLPDQPWLPLQFGTFEKVTTVQPAQLGDILTKSGRSGHAHAARVDGLGIYRVPYETRLGSFEYRDIEGFKLTALPELAGADRAISERGDSGAVWVSTTSGAAIGLQFGDESLSSSGPKAVTEGAIACDLGSVFDRLNLRLADFNDLLEQNNQEPILTDYQRRQSNLSFLVESSSPDLSQPYQHSGLTPHIASAEGRPDRRDRAATMAEVVPLVRISARTDGFPQSTMGHDAGFSLERDIWRMRLYPALLDYDANFHGVLLDECVTQRISAADSRSIRAFFAHLINNTRYFDGIGLKQMRPGDFKEAMTYTEVCERILALVPQG